MRFPTTETAPPTAAVQTTGSNVPIRPSAALRRYALRRRSAILELAGIGVFLLFVLALLWRLLPQQQWNGVAWPQALSTLLSLGVAILVYRQWRALRHEISIDKYYDRLDVVNRRMEALPGITKEFMHAYAEMDKLEYVVIKYQLGYMPPELACRGLDNFRQVCRTMPEFRKCLKDLLHKAAYLETTKQIAQQILAEEDAVNHSS